MDYSPHRDRSPKPLQTIPIVIGIIFASTSLLSLVYTALVGVSFYLAYEIRFDFLVPESYQQERVRLLPVVIGIKFVTLVAARQLGWLVWTSATGLSSG